MPMRVLVVEDQPQARTRLVELVAAEPDVEVVGACATGLEAVHEIRAHGPDLVFLDLLLPELDGFSVMAELGSDMPLTICVSAYEEYAVRAFDLRVFDYILKPYSRDRLRASLAAARRRLEEGREELLARQVASLVTGSADAAPPAADRLVVRSAGRVVIVPLDELEAVESQGNYVRLHTTERAFLVRETLSAVEERLGAGRFCRAHRRWLVNVAHVRELSVRPGCDPELVLRGGRHLRVGRAFRAQVVERWRATGPSRDVLPASPGSSGSA